MWRLRLSKGGVQMVVPMARPTKRPHTANLIARKVVPAEVRHLIGKTAGIL